MSTGWNYVIHHGCCRHIINLLGNEYWLEHRSGLVVYFVNYKPTGK